MSLHTGDCLEVMAGLPENSVDAVVCDPPYGLEFMGKEWDRLGDVGKTSHSGATASSGSLDPSGKAAYSRIGVAHYGSANRKCRACHRWEWSGNPCKCETPDFETREAPQARLMQRWHQRWATEALRVAKPGAYLLAFGGTRTYHRLAVAVEDAGWIIRDCLVWAYASGFPKSRALLKPAWEPIVMARKPGPLRELAIDACRIGHNEPTKTTTRDGRMWLDAMANTSTVASADPAGRWPANVILTDPIFDGDTEGVVGGGESLLGGGSGPDGKRTRRNTLGQFWDRTGDLEPDRNWIGDTGTYSRFFLLPKSSRSEREPLNNLYCYCETDKPQPWVSEDLEPPEQTASTSRARAIFGATSTDDSGLPTPLSGNATSDPSSPVSRSTTSTATSRTTASPTSSLSIASPTSGSTQAARSSTASGGSDAPSASSTDLSSLSGGTSHPKAGPSTDDAGPATSLVSSRTNVCGDCGKPRSPLGIGGEAKSGGRVNVHPTQPSSPST